MEGGGGGLNYRKERDKCLNLLGALSLAPLPFFFAKQFGPGKLFKLITQSAQRIHQKESSQICFCLHFNCAPFGWMRNKSKGSQTNAAEIPFASK